MIFLLKVTTVEQLDNGLRLSPGIRPSEMQDRPGIGSMTQGSPLELRRPDGTVLETTLITFGVPVMRRDDGTIYTTDDPSDPEIKLTISSDLDPDDVSEGTGVWLKSEDATEQTQAI